MNRTMVLYNLEEALEEIGIILRDYKRDTSYSEERFYRAMQHVMRHVNIAWNARDASAAATEDPTDDQMRTWNQYPSDLPPL
jgi:enamine deaminase RidA (YjgF/YER057c/UK114 family)